MRAARVIDSGPSATMACASDIVRVIGRPHDATRELPQREDRATPLASESASGLHSSETRVLRVGSRRGQVDLRRRGSRMRLISKPSLGALRK
jgi:hypothetical protein